MRDLIALTLVGLAQPGLLLLAPARVLAPPESPPAVPRATPTCVPAGGNKWFPTCT